MPTILLAVKETFRQWRLIVVIYLVQLVISSIFGLQVYQVLEASIGRSPELDVLAEGFDRTVIEDFLNIHGASLSPLFGLLRWIVPVYLLISVFCYAGVVGNLSFGQMDTKSFLKYGYRYFWPFLKIAFFSLVVLFLLMAILWAIYFAIIGDPIKDLSSEKPFVLSLLAMVVISIFATLKVWIWAVIARFAYVNKLSFWQAIKQAYVVVWKGKAKFSLVLLLIVLCTGLIGLLYYLVSGDRGSGSMFIVWLSIFIAQFFSILRIFLRVFYYRYIQKTFSL